MSNLNPFVYYNGNSLAFYLTEGLMPVLRISGKKAQYIFEALTTMFGDPTPQGILQIPPNQFPVIISWAIASITHNDPQTLLKKTLRYTPRVVADYVWELVYLSSLKHNGKKRKALIDGNLARQASKHLKGLIEIYHEAIP